MLNLLAQFLALWLMMFYAVTVGGYYLVAWIIRRRMT